MPDFTNVHTKFFSFFSLQLKGYHWSSERVILDSAVKVMMQTKNSSHNRGSASKHSTRVAKKQVRVIKSLPRRVTSDSWRASAEHRMCSGPRTQPHGLRTTRSAAATLTVSACTPRQHAYAFKGFNDSSWGVGEKRTINMHTHSLIRWVYCFLEYTVQIVIFFVTLKIMGFLLLKSKLLTMKKVQYKIIHIKPNSPSQLTLGTTNYMWLLRFCFQILAPTSFLFTAGTCREKHSNPLTWCVWGSRILRCVCGGGHEGPGLRPRAHVY